LIMVAVIVPQTNAYHLHTALPPVISQSAIVCAALLLMKPRMNRRAISGLRRMTSKSHADT